MALKVRFRHDPAATWTSVNPILASGEVGVELDTGRIKVGDGSTVWTSLAYLTTTGATQTKPYQSFGDGSDGDVTVSSGVTSLVQDMFYNNLTLSGTGQIFTNGFRIFVKGTLDLTNATIGAINANGPNGGNASGATGGSINAGYTDSVTRGQNPGTAGSTGTSAAGTGSTGVTSLSGNGGSSNAAGAGGASSVTGSTAGGAGQPPIPTIIRNYRTNYLRNGVNLVGGGVGARGGSSGSGDGVNSGGGGGAGGTGAGVVLLYVNKILTASTTSPRAIQALGGNGGNGANGTAGSAGGGGGGGGAGGGWIYVCYNEKAGPVTLLFAVNGGSGGNGGDGGTGGFGAGGGQAGQGGSIYLYKCPADTGLRYNSVTDAIFVPESLISTTASANTLGRTGGTPTLREVNF